MKKFITVLFALTLALAFVLPTTTSAATIEKTVKQSIGTKNTSMTLRSVKTGKIIYEHNGTVGRQTASNMKLLTGATALGILGEDYRYETRIYIDGEIVDNVLKGNVYLQGTGDPTLMYDNLKKIAMQLKKQGINKVTGKIYADDTLFTDSTLPRGATKSEETYYYAARTSALSMSPNEDFDAGTVIVQVTGSKVGKAATVKVIPHTSGQVIVNKTTTGKSTSISVKRQYNTNQIVVTGTIPAGKSTKTWVTVKDPTLATGYAFTGALKAVDIQAASTATKKATPSNATLIYTHQSRTLSAMFNPYMKLSNNSMADLFIRTIAAEKYGTGTLSLGLKEAKGYLAAIGVTSTGMTLVDGSGLSSKNRVSSNIISELLYEMQYEPTFIKYYDSLPVGGNANRLIGGTLKNRFTGTYAGRVHAKTGYINNVYSLYGFVKTKKGNTFIFSILTENQSSSAIANVDKVVKTLIDKY